MIQHLAVIEKKQQNIFILKNKNYVTNKVVRTAKSDNFPDLICYLFISN